MIETLSRRKLLGGLGLLIAAPAIVRVASLMPVKALPEVYEFRQVALGFSITGTELEALNEQSVARLAAFIRHRQIVHEGVKLWWKQQFEALQANPNQYIGQIVG